MPPHRIVSNPSVDFEWQSYPLQTKSQTPRTETGPHSSVTFNPFCATASHAQSTMRCYYCSLTVDMASSQLPYVPISVVKRCVVHPHHIAGSLAIELCLSRCSNLDQHWHLRRTASATHCKKSTLLTVGIKALVPRVLYWSLSS